MKVTTKTLAFTDQTEANDGLTVANDRLTVANDRLTGANDRLTGANDRLTVANDRLTRDTSVIAFRASALKNGYSNNKPGICFRKLVFFVKLIRIS